MQEADARRLIRTALRSCARKYEEGVEGKANERDTKNHRCDGEINLPKIAGEGAAEEQERNLKHQRQRLHHVVEVTGDDTVELALSILAVFDGGPPHVGGRVSVQPLLAEHRKEGGEEGSGETCK